MADASFPRALALVLKHEGGYVDHPADPGGATNLGITRAALAVWRGRPVSKDEVRALGRDEAAAIYRANYWIAAGCPALPAGYDYAHFDAAVNSGPGRAAKFRAAAPPDGTGPAGQLEAIRRYCAARLVFLRGLSTFSTFGRGWTRRVAEVEAAACALTGVGPALIEAEGKRAEAKRKQAGGTLAGGIAAGPGAAAAAPPVAAWTAMDWAIAAAMAAALVLLVAWAWRRMDIQKLRAAAHTKIAAALKAGKDLADALD